MSDVVCIDGQSAHTDQPYEKPKALVNFRNFTTLVSRIHTAYDLVKDQCQSFVLTVPEATILIGNMYDRRLFLNPESFNLFCDTLDGVGWVSGLPDAKFLMEMVDQNTIKFTFTFFHRGKVEALTFHSHITPLHKLELTEELLEQSLSLT